MKKLVHVKSSYIVAALFTIALVAWMYSGQLAGKENPQPVNNAVTENAQADLMTVRVRIQNAQEVKKEIVINGRTAPSREVRLRAETSGRVVGIGAKEGDRVKKGDIIVRLDMRDRAERLERAKAVLRQRKLEYEASKKLIKSGYDTRVKLAQTAAAVETAWAELKRIEIEIENTVIKAPFDGVLEFRDVELGDFADTGETVAGIIDIDPILVKGEVSELEVENLSLGQRGFAKLVTGQKVEGSVSFISRKADDATRTFEVELEMPNPHGKRPAGITCEVSIPLETTLAHFVSPALLSLNEEGALGIKTVNDEGVVVFYNVEIVKSGPDGIWLGGLPETLRIITVGQGFVRHGDGVRAVPEKG